MSIDAPYWVPPSTTLERPAVAVPLDAPAIDASADIGLEGDTPPYAGLDASPDVATVPDAPHIDAASSKIACGEDSTPMGLVASTALRAGKATGIALNGNQLFMSAHGFSLTRVPGAIHPCPEVATTGVDRSGIIEQFDINDRFDPLSKGATCLADQSAQEIWALAADRGDLFAAGDYVGLVAYRAGIDGLRGSKPTAIHPPPQPAPEYQQGILPYDTCGWIPGMGIRYPAAVSLTVATPPGWPKRIGLVGYLYCNLVGVYDLSRITSPAIPLVAYYRTASPSSGYVNSTIATAWGDDSDRFYMLSTIYALNGTWSYQFEVVRMASVVSVPARLGAITVSRPLGGGVGALAASGRYVYWAASEAEPHPGGLRIFDVADPANPLLVGRLDIPRAGFMPWKGSSLAVSGSTVYFAGADGLHLIDVSDPKHPSTSGQAFHRWPEAFGICHGGYPILIGDYVYVAVNCFPDDSEEGTGGLAIYHVRSARNRTCDGQCVNVDENRRHCGGCNQPCNPYQTCVRGACVSG